METNKIDQLFKQKLRFTEVTPEKETWERLHQQLHKKKKGVLFTRMAVAASIILIFTLGYVFFYYNMNLDNGFIEGITTSVNNSKRPKFNPDQNASPNLDINKTQPEIKSEKAAPENAIAQSVSSSSDKDLVAVKKDFRLPEEQNSDTEGRQHEILAEAINSENSASKKIVIIVKEQLSPTKEAIASNEENENMSIKIVYKTGKDQNLLTSGKKNIVEKGVERIAGLADDLVITEYTKNRLRNAKEDIMALNLGRVFNKSNKDAEN